MADVNEIKIILDDELINSCIEYLNDRYLIGYEIEEDIERINSQYIRPMIHMALMDFKNGRR